MQVANIFVFYEVTESGLLWAEVITHGWKYEISLAVKWCINNINGRADHEPVHITRTYLVSLSSNL